MSRSRLSVMKTKSPRDLPVGIFSLSLAFLTVPGQHFQPPIPQTATSGEDSATLKTVSFVCLAVKPRKSSVRSCDAGSRKPHSWDMGQKVERLVWRIIQIHKAVPFVRLFCYVCFFSIILHFVLLQVLHTAARNQLIIALPPSFYGLA